MDNFCKIHITGKIKLGTLKKYIDEIVSPLNFTTLNIFYEENTDYDKRKEVDFPDGFLYFRYIVDFESYISRNDVIFLINKILSKLWLENIPAIAVCDFEDMLIKRGGYRDKSIPFPR